MINGKEDILSLDEDSLANFLENEPSYRVKQVYSWLHKGCAFEEMTNVPKALRERLEKEAVIASPSIEKKLVSKIDGTVKYLYKLYDGQCVESVIMKYEHGYTICVSSQAGCKMGCAFCASTKDGYARDLLPSEIEGQILVSQRDLGIRISNVVMMGIGEPLDNYDNVIGFLKNINSEDGLNIGLRHVSLSTCGLADRIRDLANEGLPVTLSVSLHHSNDSDRSALMPVNRRWNIDALLSACNYYFEKTGRRISFEYAVIGGVNATEEKAKALAKLLHAKLDRDMPFHVNLIPVNPVRETGFKSTRKEVDEFRATLEKCGVNATVRRRLGSDINASCGQLRRQALGESI